MNTGQHRADHVDQLLAEADRLHRISSNPPPPPEIGAQRAEAMIEEARTLWARGQRGEAADRLRAAARAPSQALRALSLLARLERQMAMPLEAAATLKQALHEATHSPAQAAAIYAEIGEIHDQLGEGDEALYYYRRAQRLAPSAELAARVDAIRRRHGPAPRP